MRAITIVRRALMGIVHLRVFSVHTATCLMILVTALIPQRTARVKVISNRSEVTLKVWVAKPYNFLKIIKKISNSLFHRYMSLVSDIITNVIMFLSVSVFEDKCPHSGSTGYHWCSFCDDGNGYCAPPAEKCPKCYMYLGHCTCHPPTAIETSKNEGNFW